MRENENLQMETNQAVYLLSFFFLKLLLCVLVGIIILDISVMLPDIDFGSLVDKL